MLSLLSPEKISQTLRLKRVTQGMKNRLNGISFQVPDWFLDHNVKSAEECVGLRKTNSIAVWGQETGSHEINGLSGIHDMIRGMLRGRKADYHNLLLRTGETEDSSGLRMAVEWLAIEIEADLITIDSEDLMDLAVEFFNQERDYWEERKAPHLSELPAAYFNTADTKNASTFRSRKALAAIFDSPNIKRSNTGKPPSNARTCSKMVILYVHNVASLYGASSGKKILVTLRQWIQGLHRKQPALLIGTAFAGENGRRPNDLFMLSIGESLLIDQHFDLDIHSPGVKSPASGRRELNLRRLRRTLLFRLGNCHPFESTDPYSSWNCGALQSSDLLDKEIFPDFVLERAEMQVMGQMEGNPSPDLGVICDIVSRVSREYIHQKSLSSKSVSSGTGSDYHRFHMGLDKPSSIKELLNAIEGTCSEYEKKLFDTVIDPEKLDVTFDEVAIDHDAKDIVKELFTLRKVLSNRWLKFIGNSGILLYGPPGTGKTHLSRAIAKDVGVNMLTITPADVESRWLGDSEKTIQAAFSLARKLAPCVLFIDEVDGLFSQRTSGSKRWERETINQFLQEMDGIDTKQNSPMVVGATNRPQDLDEAFMRRLPHKVLFSLPTQHQRHGILQTLIKKSDLDPSVSLEEISQTTTGYSGADLKELCSQAIIISASEHVANRKASKEDEQATERLDTLILKPHHFAKALKRIRPSCPDGATREVRKFAQRFNPSQGNGA
ncbi:hypothetical protein ASPCADRAFT_129837 [Aspergillus carbonarius ITEM 5010]|uniref:AAA+ ATPase domain-containing protein n=1 Tax=Aspergillus carbonarius (strain ITEM 5010) TaxID=602072 RepID=A0A1R3RQM3_ASPC5|nr:hypothetical protein ASPCADRAFT_129837 [Aspergillus carbonarius ITEM 5010]